MSHPIPLSRKDFETSQTVRWCPGCGDYAILAQMQRTLPELGIPKEKLVFISGIGCAARFPYYMNTYGIHTIHGRAPTIATGLKLANPDLSVWVITGDGDALSIGGNHLLHAMRRNLNLNIILFNNRIYGLTKGQYSPTSSIGTRTKSTPMGSIDRPFNPVPLVLSAEATFVARTTDVDLQHLGQMLKRAAAHQGTSFVEVYQNCVIFNDGVWDYATDRKTRAETILKLEHGQPLIFGAKQDKGIRLKGFRPEVVSLAEVDVSELLVHDETAPDPSLASLLARLHHPEFPEAMGVFRDIEQPLYERQIAAQVDQAVASRGEGDLAALYQAGDTWTI